MLQTPPSANLNISAMMCIEALTEQSHTALAAIRQLIGVMEHSLNQQILEISATQADLLPIGSRAPRGRTQSHES